MLNMLKSLARDEQGATMVEYGLMLALIAAVSIPIVQALGVNVQGAFSAVNNAIAAV